MNHVRDHSIEEGHTFPRDKIALQLHIVEEASLFGVRFLFRRSNNCQVLAKGNNFNPFIVCASFDSSKTQSWIVGTCITHSGRHIYVPPDQAQLVRKGKPKAQLPPVSIHDLPPPEKKRQ
jgi:hypothetical protein